MHKIFIESKTYISNFKTVSRWFDNIDIICIIDAIYIIDNIEVVIDNIDTGACIFEGQRSKVGVRDNKRAQKRLA